MAEAHLESMVNRVHIVFSSHPIPRLVDLVPRRIGGRHRQTNFPRRIVVKVRAAGAEHAEHLRAALKQSAALKG